MACASNTEWTLLTNSLGGPSVAGGKLKETGNTHWNSPNTQTTNESGFTALPGSNRSYNGTFDDIGHNGVWWSSTESSAIIAYGRSLWSDTSYINRNNASKKCGFSVRCVRD